MARAKKPKGFASIDISGVEEAIEALRELPKQVNQRVMKQAFTAAFQDTLTAAKKNAETAQDSGATEQALMLTCKTSKKTGFTVARIGADKDAVFDVTIKTPDGKTRKVRRRPVRYLHLIEKGTQPHRLGKGQMNRKTLKSAALAALGQAGGMHPGTKPHPVLRKALDETEAVILPAFEKEFEKRFTSVVKRLRKKAAKG